MKNIRDNLEKIKHQILICPKCRLALNRTKAVPGEGATDTKFMLIGEAPGKREDELGKPFVGVGGKFLDEILNKFKIDRERAFITSVIKCHPPKNRRPYQDEIESCLPYLWHQINLLNPALMVILGDVALKSVLQVEQSLSELHGNIIFWEGREIVPTYHPNAALRFPKVRSRMEKDFALIVEELKRMQLWKTIRAQDVKQLGFE